MTDLDQIRADVRDLHGHAARMHRESRGIMARHAGIPLFLIEYVTESERAWGHVMERCHDLETQLLRRSAREAQDGDRAP